MKLSLKHQRGFTLWELITGLFWLGFCGLFIWVVAHFIIKFW